MTRRGRALPGTALTGSSGARALLIVLAVEEPRNVERVAGCASPRFFLVDLSLGGAPGDVRHALEQGAAFARRWLRRRLGAGLLSKPGSPAPGRRIGLVISHGRLFRLEIDSVEQQLVTFLFVR